MPDSWLDLSGFNLSIGVGWPVGWPASIGRLGMVRLSILPTSATITRVMIFVV